MLMVLKMASDSVSDDKRSTTIISGSASVKYIRESARLTADSNLGSDEIILTVEGLKLQMSLKRSDNREKSRPAILRRAG